MEKKFGPMPAGDLKTLFAAHDRCAAVATFVKPDMARPRRKQVEKRTADGPPGFFSRNCESQSDSASLSHHHYFTSLVQTGAAESDWEPEREHSVPTHRVPRGGPRHEMRQTASGWLDSAFPING